MAPHAIPAEFDLSESLLQATLEAGVRAIADQQWAIATYPTLNRAFFVAQDRHRTTQPSPDIEVAEGNCYVLTRDHSAQVFTVIAKIDDREIARYDGQGRVVNASPSLQDRLQWRAIAQRV